MISSSTFACPHCKATISMDHGENYLGHVTYWGEDEPKPFTCHKCEGDFFVQEHVSRWWEAGKTVEEARDA